MKKVTTYLFLALVSIAITAALTTSDKARHILNLKSPWHDNYSQAKGELLASYGFPYVFNYFLLHSWGTGNETNPNKRVYNAANQFHHIRNLTKADYRDGGSPNNDTLYSVVWMYVGDEPMIISTPPMDKENRYWSMEFAGWNSDNYAYLGMRTTGMNGGHYAVVPKGWKGELPDGVEFLAEAPTSWSFVLGRTLIESELDLPNAHLIQDGYTLTALSDWGRNNPGIPYYPPLDKDFAQYRDMFEDKSIGFRGILKQFIKQNPDDYLAIMNRSIAMGGLAETEHVIFGQFSEIGLNIPGSTSTGDQLIESFIPGRNRGLALGLLDVIEGLSKKYGTKSENGWGVPDKSLGRAGLQHKYLFRASTQSLGGIVANDPMEAVYFIVADDPGKDGIQKPHGKNTYTLHFTKDQLPDVKAFWSISAYDETNNLIPNSLDRYSRGDRDDLSFNPDGSLTLFVGVEPPKNQALYNNWLPVLNEEFYLIFRTYLPGEEIVEQRWVPPALKITE